MKNIGIVSYNIRCNYTNYGSALQSWALKESIKKLGYEVKLVDYCPKVHLDSDPLNPLKNSYDKDLKEHLDQIKEEIKENYYKFEDFYNNKFDRTKKMYTSTNFDKIAEDEDLHNFVCGGDTIFCTDEFGVDEIYYGNCNVMKNGYTFAYGASFGDSNFTDEIISKIDEYLPNFKAIGIRERGMLDHIKSVVDVPVSKVIDPTLLLHIEDYDSICNPPVTNEKYILLYSRRYNANMIKFADDLAKKTGLKIIDISLRKNPDHEMFYNAGVEEFLSLVKNAEYVVTNSFHGIIFSVQFRKNFFGFSRQQCDTKINELMELFGLEYRLLVDGSENVSREIDYISVHNRIDEFRNKSLEFLKMELDGCK